MSVATRSILTAGVTLVSVSAVALAPSVQPPPPPVPAVQLAASSQQAAQSFDPITIVTDLAGRILIPPGVGTPIPPAGQPPVFPAPTSIGSSIKDIYNSVEFWVDYGFEVGAWAFSWVPWIGWLAPQIWPIGYNFGERIVRSITFNIADWLDGNVSFVQGLTNVGVDTVNSFIQLGIDEWNFWLPSIPIPPLPGILSTTQQQSSLASVANTQAAGIPDSVKAALAPLKATEKAVTDGIDLGTRAFKVATGNAVTAVDLATDAVGTAVDDIPVVGDIAKVAQQVSQTARQTIPPTVGQAADDNAGVAKAVIKAPRKLTLGVVKGGVRVTGALEKATTDIANAAATGDPGNAVQAVAKAPNTVAKGALDGLHKVAKRAEKAGKGIQQAIRNTGNEE
jgi:hypothetical protein